MFFLGRPISDDINLLGNVFDFVERTNIKCAFRNIDQDKAFYRVSIKYLLKVLKAFGFEPLTFIEWIDLLCKDISNVVIVNCHIGVGFLGAEVSDRAVPYHHYHVYFQWSLPQIGLD